MLNKQRKKFKDFLVLLLKGFIMFTSIIIVYKGFSINTKFRLKPVAKKTLI
jgi:hypothetical protein